MYIVDDEELRLRHELARYRCQLDGDTDEDTDRKLRDAIAQIKFRLQQLETVRIGEIIAGRDARHDHPRGRFAFARFKFGSRHAHHP